MNHTRISFGLSLAISFAVLSATALAQGPGGGGGFNPGGGGFTPGGGGGGTGGTLVYDTFTTDTTNTDHTVYRTESGLLYRLAASPTAVATPAAVIAIADGLFAGCTELTSADLSASAITELPESCFAGCSALTHVVLPTTCTTIGPNAFAGCTALSSVVASSVSIVGADAFRGCTALEHLPVFASETALGPYAFSACTGLVAADLSALALSAGAFAGCSTLATVTDAPTTLPDAIFSGCSALDFDTSALASAGQAALAGVPVSTISLDPEVILSDYALAADVAPLDTRLVTADFTAFDPASLAFLGRTLSCDTGNGIARLEAVSLVAWLSAKASDEASSTTQPATYSTADLETWLADPDNLDAILAYTAASLTVDGDAFLFTPPAAAATSVTVALEGCLDLVDDPTWSPDALALSSTDADGVETHLPVTTGDTPPTRAFARITFTPAW